jgi:hypothetical protein
LGAPQQIQTARALYPKHIALSDELTDRRFLSNEGASFSKDA